MRFVLALLASLAIPVLPQVGHAHDLTAIVVEAQRTRTHSLSTAQTTQPTGMLVAVQRDRVLQSKALAAISEEGGLSFASALQVLTRLNAWPLHHVFSICFDAGTPPALRQHVTSAIITSWPLRGLLLSYGPSFTASVAPDCPDDIHHYRAYDIRVGFDPSMGETADIGQPGEEAFTFNLGTITAISAVDEEFKRLVAHEMGHVLGLYHEQQHPEAPCKWNKTTIMVKYGWQESDWEANMSFVARTLAEGASKYRFTPFDKHSIMQYELGPALFEDGTSDSCYVKLGNQRPDPADHAIIVAAYGPQALGAERFALQNAPKLLPQLGAFPALKSQLERNYILMTSSGP
jgi:hypothetical protein